MIRPSIAIDHVNHKVTYSLEMDFEKIMAEEETKELFMETCRQDIPINDVLSLMAEMTEKLIVANNK